MSSLTHKAPDSRLTLLTTVSPSLASRVIREETRLKHPGIKGKPMREFLESIPEIPPQSQTPHSIADTTCQRAVKEVQLYKKAIGQAIATRRRVGYDDIALGLVVLAILIASLFFADLSGKLASIGLSGVTAYSKAGEIKKADQDFRRDRNKLENDILLLEAELEGCDMTDPKACSKVIDDVIQSLKGLNDSAGL